MRRAYSFFAPVKGETLPEGVLDFDLVTPHRDTYGTRLDPMGAEFHSEARPWLDTHASGSVRNVLGDMVQVVEQSPERFRVRVRFNMDKQIAAETYADHVRGFLRGCSLGFDPIEGATRVELGEGGDCEGCGGEGETKWGPCGQCFATGVAGSTLVYERYKIREGSSCATPSNPMALCVRAAEDGLRAAQRAGITKLAHLAPPQQVGPKTTWTTSSTITKRDAQPFAFTTGVFKMLTPELRDQIRWSISDQMRSAGDALAMMAATSDESLRAFFKECARGCMKTALGMVNLMTASIDEMGGHADAAQDVALFNSMMRAAPEKLGDEEMAKEWAACQRACLPHAEQTFADVGGKIAKTPAELRTKFAAMQTVEAAHKRMLSEQRSAAAKTEDSERQKLVLEIAASDAGLEPGLEAEMLGMDPVGYVRGSVENKRASRPWSLEQLRTFKIQVAGAVAQVTRTAPLRSGDGTAPPSVLAPPPAARETRSADPALDGVFAMMARRGGLDVERLRSAAAGIRPGATVESSTMNDRLAERPIRPLNPNGATVVVNEQASAPADARNIRMERK